MEEGRAMVPAFAPTEEGIFRDENWQVPDLSLASFRRSVSALVAAGR